MQFKTSLRIAALLLAAAAGVRAAQVRPLSEGERAAVQTSAAYLSRGAEAVYEQLAPSSPLLKLRKEDALAEIETRLGPPAGATFELQTVVPALKDDTAAFTISYPSGIDETAVFEMTPDNRIANLRILAEPSLNAPPFPPEKATDTTAAEPENGPSHVPLLLGMLAAFLGIVAASILKLNATAAKSILAVCVLLAAGGGWLGLHDDPRLEAAPKAAPATAEKTYPRIGSLLPLRRILAAGVGDVDAAYRQVAIGGFAKDVATLWKAQYDLQQMKLPEVERALKAFPPPSSTPLAEILRGRAAFEQAKEIDTVVAYERAIDLGPGRDALWMEAAQALDTLGFDDRAHGYLTRLINIGSRDANVYYSAAVLAVAHDREDDAEKTLRQAWTLRPAERASLIRAGTLWSTLRRPSISAAVH